MPGGGARQVSAGPCALVAGLASVPSPQLSSLPSVAPSSSPSATAPCRAHWAGCFAFVPRSRVLACAASNVAVDNLVERLARQSSKLAVVRVGHPARLLPQVRTARLCWLLYVCWHQCERPAADVQPIPHASLHARALQLPGHCPVHHASQTSILNIFLPTHCRFWRTAWRLRCSNQTTRHWPRTAARR